MNFLNIRSITIGENVPFFDENLSVDVYMQKRINNFSNLTSELKYHFEKMSIPVQTTRFCSQPIITPKNERFALINPDQFIQQLKEDITDLEKVLDYKFDYFSCNIMEAESSMNLKYLSSLLESEVPQIIADKEKFFTSLSVASTQFGINLDALRLSAKIIKEISLIDPFNNLKFCVSSNVPPNTPFFPSAVHKGDKSSFSLAIEMADIVYDEFMFATGINDAKSGLKRRFIEIYNNLTEKANKISKKYGMNFSGMDFSPAPFPKEELSIGSAIEKFGIEYFGSHGTIAAIALLKSCIPQKEKVIGFSGFMQPVFEDYTIAKRLNEKKFTLDTLLLNSCICGTGLDCIPLPGDTSIRELFYILLDVSIISITHNKPLTARLMPIPGKKAGDPIEFDFEYFAPTSIIDFKRLTAPQKKDLYSGEESFYTLFS